MTPLGWMLAYAVFAWWFSTGAILFLNHLKPATFKFSLAAATLVLAAAIAGIAITAHDATPRAAYIGFTCALLAWGWQEMSFFMGLITGPRRTADLRARGATRFWQATQTLIYHEAAIAAAGIAILALSAGHPNQIGAAVYLSLWAMRVSAKLNVYLGVRNLNENWVPRRLAYLKAYMSKARMNPLLPISVAAGSTAAAMFLTRAVAPGATHFTAISNGFTGVILALGVIEHIVMVLPFNFARLWGGFADTCPVAKDLPALATCPHMAASRSLLPNTLLPNTLLPKTILPGTLLPNALERS